MGSDPLEPEWVQSLVLAAKQCRSCTVFPSGNTVPQRLLGAFIQKVPNFITCAAAPVVCRLHV